MIFDNSQGCTSSVRTFRVPAVVEKEVIIPDSIGDEYSPAGRIVTAWLEERLFGFSMDLRRELYHDEYAVVEHAVNSLTALYRAAELAIATNRS